jgi:hypothetical protein
MDRDWQKALVVLLTVLVSLALLWVLWQVVSPILHTLVLFGLAAVLAFALSGPVDMLTPRVGNRLLAIVTIYVLVGVLVVGGIILIAGPFVRQASELASALPQYANDLQARAPEVQTTLGQYGIQTDLDQLKAQAAAAVEQGGTDVLKNLVGTLAEVGGMLLDIVLALVISLYLLVDGPRFGARSLAIIPPQHRAKALFLQDNVSRVLGGYLRGQLTLALIIGLLAGVGTALLGPAVCRRPRSVGGPVRAGADVRAYPVGDPGRPGGAVHAVPDGRLATAVLSGYSAAREQRIGTSHQWPCSGAASARSYVRAAGRLSAGRAAWGPFRRAAGGRALGAARRRLPQRGN